MKENKGTMTDAQRIEAVLKGQKPDRVPILPFGYGGFAVMYTGTSISDAYNKPEAAVAAIRKTSRDFGWVSTPAIGYASFGAWELGGEIKWPSSEFQQAPMITRHPVETEDDVYKLAVPKDIGSAGIIPIQRKVWEIAAQEKIDNEPFNVLAYAGGPFTRACNICGTEKLCRWLIKKPDITHRVMQAATDFMKAVITYWANTFGTEKVLVWGGEALTTNGIISSGQFEEFVLPYIKELHETVFSLGYKHMLCHICGDQYKNLPHWAQIPMGNPGIVSIDHRLELKTAAEYFPNHVILGNLDTTIIQVGSPQEIYEATKKNIQEGMNIEGGYIFSPGCEMPPLAPAENVMAMTRAVNDFGWYD